VAVTDGNGGWDWSNFTLTVQNKPPTITTPDDMTAVQDVAYYNDYDSDDDDQGTTTWQLDTNASWLNFDTGTGELSGTPTNDDVGTYWVNVSVDDGNGGLDWNYFILTVSNTNDAPTITTGNDPTATEDQLYSNDYDATDIDGNTLTWNVATNASWLNINSTTGLLSGTPINSDVGTYWVNVSVNDGNGGSDQNNFTLTVHNVPAAILTADITVAFEDSLYYNDYDSDDDGQGTVTWALAPNPNTPWLSMNNTSGELEGTPSNSDVGTFSIVMIVKDGNGGVTWRNFTLTVQNVNDAPVITTINIPTATEDQPYGNDYDATDIDGNNLTWSLSTNASWLYINESTGYIDGMPNQTGVGVYWVNVSVSDGNGGTDSTNFTLTVINVNDAPVITTGDNATADEDALYSIDYDANDDEGDTLTWSLAVQPPWLSIDANTGVLSGTPDNSEVGPWTVNVTVTDGNGGTDWRNFTITVQNKQPTITTPDTTNAVEDVAYYNDYDSDDDGQGTITWQLDTNASWLNFDTGTGELSGIPTNADVGTYWVNVSVDDGNGGWDWNYFILTVSNTNDAPTITTGNDPTATEDQLYSNDYDADDDDGDTLTWSLASNASWLGINATSGILNGTPLQANIGSYWVNMSVDDGNGGLDWTNFTLTVINVNDAPVITTGDDATADEDVLYDIDYDANDDDGDTLTWSLAVQPPWLSIDANTGLLSGMPDNSEVGPWTVNVTVTDGNDGWDWRNFTITVQNKQPTITTPDITNAVEDVAYYNDYDSDDDDQGTITWHLETNASSWLSIDAASGELSGTPTNGDVGTYWVNVSVDDGNGGLDYSYFTLTVQNVNDPPVIVVPPITSPILEDAFVSWDFDGVDIDNDTLAWIITTNASWLSANLGTAVINGTPMQADIGFYWVNVTVDDGNGGSDNFKFWVNVTNVNDAPVITTGNNGNAYEDASYYVDYDADDEDGDTLNWTLETNTTWLVINNMNGLLSGTPSQADVGSYWINVSVNDGNGAEDWTNFTLIVHSTNDLPTITNDNLVTAFEDQPYYNDYDAADIDGDTLAWQLASDATWLSIDAATGELSGTPLQADVGSYWVNVSVDDGNGGTDFRNFTLVVLPVNDAPVIAALPDIYPVEDVTYAWDVAAYISDVDNSTAELIITENSTYATVSGTVITFLYPEGVLFESVGIWVSDSLLSNTATFAAHIIPVNDPPVIITADVIIATEDSLYYVDYDATDVDGGTMVWGLSTNASWLSIDPATGVISGTPTQPDIGSYWVSVSAFDSNDGWDWSNYTLTVINVNDPPDIITTPVQIVNEDEFYYVDFDAVDEDGDVLAWSLQTVAGWLSIDASSGELSGTPSNDDVGNWTIAVSVTDGPSPISVFIVSLAFNITVINVNDAPQITTQDVLTATEDTFYSSDYDAVDDDGDVLSWAMTVGPAWLDIDTDTGMLSGTPLQVDVDVGSHPVSIVVSDGNGGFDYSNFTLTVENVNDLPVITTTPVLTALEDSLYFVDFDANDEDGDVLAWALNTSATWLFMDSTTGELSGIPDNDEVGVWTVTVIVMDGNGGTDAASFTITVEDVNNPPVPVPVFKYIHSYVNITFRITGDAGNSVKLTVLEDDNAILTVTLIRFLGRPQEMNLSVMLDPSMEYQIVLTHEGVTGSNPVTLTFECMDNAYTEHYILGTGFKKKEVVVGNIFKIMGFVHFDASGSYDVDGTIASYNWDFGDGTTATGVSAYHQYSTMQSYVATLTVTDDKGAQGVALFNVNFTYMNPANYISSNKMALLYLRTAGDKAVILACPANLNIVDDSGAQVGYVEGEFSDTMDGGIRAFNLERTEIYYVPVTKSYTYEVNGEDEGNYTISTLEVTYKRSIEKVITSTTNAGDQDKIVEEDEELSISASNAKTYSMTIESSGKTFTVTQVPLTGEDTHTYGYDDITEIEDDGGVYLEVDKDSNGKVDTKANLDNHMTGDEVGSMLMPSQTDSGVWYFSLPLLIGFIGLIGLGGLLSIEVFKYALLALFVPLYAKIKKTQVLDYYVRGQIYGYLTANPGEHYNSIKRALSMTNGSLTYHLEVMERNDIIKSKTMGKYKRFYPADVRVPGNGHALGLTEIRKEIVKRVKETPGITQKDIAALIGVSPPTIHYHIELLLKRKLIYKERRGLSVGYYLAKGIIMRSSVRQKYQGGQVQRSDRINVYDELSK
jgi:predicted transcriptional regulator